MAENLITVQFEGVPEENGHVRLGAFIEQLEAVRSALKQAERMVSGDDSQSVYYRIIDLRHNSPAIIVLEAVKIPPAQMPHKKRRDVPDYSGATVAGFFQSLNEISEKKIPVGADLQALEAYRNLTAPLNKSISSVQIVNTSKKVRIDESFKEAIDEIIGPDEMMEGSIGGMLERVNLHNTSRFDIFPPIGPKQVVCDFKPHLRAQVIAALDKYVLVSGKIRYKKLQDFPYAINAESIELLPDESELPTIFDIRGMAPDLTGGKTTEEFLESVRDA